MDIKSIEAIMRLHQELAGRLPESVSGVVIPERQEPQLVEADVKAMRAVLEQRLRVVTEAREGALSRFDEEIRLLNQVIADTTIPSGGEPVKPAKPRPAKPPK